MGYQRTVWRDTIKDPHGNVIERGTPINAQNLNKIEEWIEKAEVLLADPALAGGDIDAGTFTDTESGQNIDGGEF